MRHLTTVKLDYEKKEALQRAGFKISEICNMAVVSLYHTYFGDEKEKTRLELIAQISEMDKEILEKNMRKSSLKSNLEHIESVIAEEKTKFNERTEKEVNSMKRAGFLGELVE